MINPALWRQDPQHGQLVRPPTYKPAFAGWLRYNVSTDGLDFCENFARRENAFAMARNVAQRDKRDVVVWDNAAHVGGPCGWRFRLDKAPIVIARREPDEAR